MNDRLEQKEELKTYRCPSCHDILFKGFLTNGTIIVKMCKNKNVRDKKGKYKKCKTISRIEGK